MASTPPRSMTCTIFSDSMASRIAWFAAAPASRRNGQRSKKWRRATATSAGVGPARGRSRARQRPGHARSARRASASAKAAATRCMASPSGAARVAMCSSAALAASSRQEVDEAEAALVGAVLQEHPGRRGASADAVSTGVWVERGGTRRPGRAFVLVDHQPRQRCRLCFCSALLADPATRKGCSRLLLFRACVPISL
ncbi:hypothetical protein ZWY2020_026808 [Hordeum vulgare]|nr:hypothetical protein ZWY2020_026808 [Hordeum vulgare]